MFESGISFEFIRKLSGRGSLFAKGNSEPSPASKEINGFLGKETLLKGKITFDGVLRLEGKFEGEIIDKGTLILGETAIVKGKIEVNTAIIGGLVEGEVYASERAEILSTGKLNGNLTTRILEINEGGILEGNCKMEDLLNKEKMSPHPDQGIPHPL